MSTLGSWRFGYAKIDHHLLLKPSIDKQRELSCAPDNFLKEEVRIVISDRHKTSGLRQTQPLLILPSFPEKPSLWPVDTLREYLTKSKALRPPNDPFLFIATKAPYNHISSQTISRWIKTVLIESGFEEVFLGHSTRHASTSAVARRGLNIDSIFRTAGWSKNSQVFAKFYNRPLIDSWGLSRAVYNL